MIFSAFVVFGLTVVLGTMISVILIPGRRNYDLVPLWLIRFGFGWGLGCGLWSWLTYLTLRVELLGAYRFVIELLISMVIFLYFLHFCFHNPNHSKNVTGDSPSTPSRSFTTVALVSIFLFSFLVAISLQILQSINNPHGEWDAWSFWNLRASFFFYNYPDWMTAFDRESANSNLDYPLFLPCLVFRIWHWGGANSVIVPAMIGLGFTIATVVLLVGALWLLKSMNQGLVAGICLLSVKMFVVNGADQYNDVPLAFYLVSSIVSISFFLVNEKITLKPLILSGVFLGILIWTKNDAQLASASLVISTFIVFVCYYKVISFYDLFVLLITSFPFFVMLSDFKINVAPLKNAYVSVDYWPRISSQLLELNRYWIILQRFITEFFTFHRWGYFVPFLVLYSLVKGFDVEKNLKPIILTSFMTVLMIVAGYFFVYVITPQELVVHLDTSLNRLFIHILPTLLFAFFLTVGKIEKC
mgnify:CR=1 FL=1